MISSFLKVVGCSLLIVFSGIGEVSAQSTAREFDEVKYELMAESVSTDSVSSNSGRIKETHDEQGRLIKVETLSGITHNFTFDKSGRIAQMKDQAGNVTIPVYKTGNDTMISGVVRLPLKPLASYGTGAKHMSLTIGDQIDPYNGGDLIEYYRSIGGDYCALVCVGIWDSISNFVGDLTKWVALGASTYGTLGVIEGILSGAEGAALLSWFGLAGIAGTGVVLAFAGGWLVGTAGYNGFMYIIYSDGRVVRGG